MARPKDQALRDRILEAAALEFAAHGFAGSSIDAIGRRAGVTKGGVYFHFRGKEELFFAALDRLQAALRDLLGPSGETRPPGLALRQLLEDYLRFHLALPQAKGLLLVLATELGDRLTTQLREDLRSTQRALRARIRELLTASIQDGSHFAPDPALATFMLASSIEGVLGQWIASPRDTEPFCRPESLVDYLLAPLETGREPGRKAKGPEDPEEGRDLLPPF